MFVFLRMPYDVEVSRSSRLPLDPKSTNPSWNKWLQAQDICLKQLLRNLHIFTGQWSNWSATKRRQVSKYITWCFELKKSTLFQFAFAVLDGPLPLNFFQKSSFFLEASKHYQILFDVTSLARLNSAIKHVVRCWTMLDEVWLCSNFSSNVVPHFGLRDQ